ncbi:MAG TPA: hypothetical protein DCS07_11830 [Bdellovibrionales bacterium]|nr:MAG: hypothetical protein A2Z97_03530 [Bdellovibrionales bacterium GWB1_52_6]OFZ04033.1 MAG: hypothetical protein A2X97_14615 [Bdellovibrionales bacterium GWA1_52_35]OFZ35237.1 MAG: hypothetical protein A2070_04935 [Bdellovibrionales bacterium GWC1_52_8]HAR43298.1 hypothetical protein [Bdellovibrionales bacterium]HCM39882.1 hypothetical protein [Bdellovibrionales bacterium]
MKNAYTIMLCALVLISGSGCATQSKSLSLGGALGAGVGAIAGGLADPGKDGQYRTRNVLIGTALGGAAGMGSGALIHGGIEDQKKHAFQQGQAVGVQSAPQPGSMPNLKDPQVEARWVEPKVAGNRYIEGHYEYVIISPARWDGR